MAEQEGFEPSVPFWGTHDFQSCPLWPLRYCSMWFATISLHIIQHIIGFVNPYFPFFQLFFRQTKYCCSPLISRYACSKQERDDNAIVGSISSFSVVLVPRSMENRRVPSPIRFIGICFFSSHPKAVGTITPRSSVQFVPCKSRCNIFFSGWEQCALIE